ncbi:MAG: hypothetical protein DMG12_23630, partial [Acidobacteria bacterium]
DGHNTITIRSVTAPHAARIRLRMKPPGHVFPNFASGLWSLCKIISRVYNTQVGCGQENLPVRLGLPKSEIGHRRSPLPNKDPQHP